MATLSGNKETINVRMPNELKRLAHMVISARSLVTGEKPESMSEYIRRLILEDVDKNRKGIDISVFENKETFKNLEDTE